MQGDEECSDSCPQVADEYNHDDLLQTGFANDKAPAGFFRFIARKDMPYCTAGIFIEPNNRLAPTGSGTFQDLFLIPFSFAGLTFIGGIPNKTQYKQWFYGNNEKKKGKSFLLPFSSFFLSYPFRHFVFADEVVESQAQPTGYKNEDDEQQLLGCVAVQFPDAQDGFNGKDNTDEPNNESHTKNV